MDSKRIVKHVSIVLSQIVKIVLFLLFETVKIVKDVSEVLFPGPSTIRNTYALFVVEKLSFCELPLGNLSSE
jgi:hypothetical protein